jgi:hypothetical protein
VSYILLLILVVNLSGVAKKNTTFLISLLLYFWNKPLNSKEKVLCEFHKLSSHFFKSKDTFMKKYMIYHFRWQLSAWIMLPLMGLLESSLPLWFNLMLGQFFGALIFWFIDLRIFRSTKGCYE